MRWGMTSCGRRDGDKFDGQVTEEIPSEQRAHFYTLLMGVCALCEADSPDDESPGCFASRCSVQGSASLALPQQLSQPTLQRKQSAGANHSRRKVPKPYTVSQTVY